MQINRLMLQLSLLGSLCGPACQKNYEIYVSCLLIPTLEKKKNLQQVNLG